MRFPWKRGARIGPETRMRRMLALAGVPAVEWLAPTGTRVDVGHWLSTGQLWVAGAPGEVILAADGDRPYVERAPKEYFGNSFYNALTGEVVLLPAEGVRQRRIRLAPVEGWELVRRIRNGEGNHA